MDRSVDSTFDATQPSSRRGFIRRSGIAALLTAPIVGVLATGSTAEAGVAGNVQEIIRTRRQLRRLFRSIQGHETTHVQFLRNALGNAARPKPTFQDLSIRKFSTFLELSRVFENVGVGAYLGAAPVISSRTILAQAGSIATVEARHAGILNDLRRELPTASPANSGSDPAFDSPLTAAQVAEAISPYVASLNGGPALTYSTTPSAANDVAILNFALALEYFEAEYYDINVPRFF